MDAKFLSNAEIVATLEEVGKNKTGIQNTTFKWDQIRELIVDPQIYLMLLIEILLTTSSGFITTYSATVVRNIGYSPKKAALLNTPSGLVSIASAVLSGWAVTRAGGASNIRFMWIVGLSIPGIVGAALVSYLPRSNHAGLLIGIYLINSV